MAERITYTEEKIAEIADRLKKKPVIKKICTKQEAITFLAYEIRSLSVRGYEWPDIIHILKEEGIEITLPTLKSYLNRASKDSKDILPKVPRKKRETPAAEPQKTNEDGSSSAMGLVQNPTAAHGKTKPDIEPTDKAKAKFTITEDTEEI